MEAKLLDSGLADIRNTLNKFARDVIAKKYKTKPEKCSLYVVVKRGDIEMKNGEVTTTSFDNGIGDRQVSLNITGLTELAIVYTGEM